MNLLIGISVTFTLFALFFLIRAVFFLGQRRQHVVGFSLM